MTQTAVRPVSTRSARRSLLHSPSESATEYVAYAEGLQNAPGVTFGVASMDRSIVPLHPGDVMGIIARPGHGKSTLAAYLARREAKHIAGLKHESSECVVYVTFEQATEEIEALFQAGDEYTVTDLAWGKVDMEAVRRGAVRRMGLPVWTMGESLVRRKQTPRMTVSTVYETLTEMEDEYGIKPTLIVFDYIQLVPVDGMSERSQQVGEAIVRSKELARHVGAPILMCVQASREADKRNVKIPTAGDCQWASAIEQASDKLLGIWRPWLTEDRADEIELDGRRMSVTERLFVARLQKQRMAAAGQTYLLNFAPEYVRLSDIELETSL